MDRRGRRLLGRLYGGGVAAEHAHDLLQRGVGGVAVDHLEVGVHLHLVEGHLRVVDRLVDLLEVLGRVGAVAAEQRDLVRVRVRGRLRVPGLG